MRRDLYFWQSVLIFTLFLAVDAWAGDNVVQKEAPHFTNGDLKQYQQPPEGETPAAENEGQSGKKLSGKKAEDREKEYWCKKAAPYRKKIDRAKDDVQTTQNELWDSSPGSKRSKSLTTRLNSSRKKLTNAERDLRDLENEAYRKGIPSGWLRCQYE